MQENIEIRARSTGSGWRVDRREIGADRVIEEYRSGSYSAAVKFARRIAARLRASGEFGSVRLFIEELF